MDFRLPPIYRGINLPITVCGALDLVHLSPLSPRRGYVLDISGVSCQSQKGMFVSWIQLFVQPGMSNLYYPQFLYVDTGFL